MESRSVYIRVPSLTKHSDYIKLRKLAEEISDYLYFRGIDYKYNMTKQSGELRFVLHIYSDENYNDICNEIREVFGKYVVLVYN